MYIEIINEEFDPWQKLVEDNRSQLKEKNNIRACSVFLGTMRDINSGDAIKSMELQHYPDMTEGYLEKIVQTENIDNKKKYFVKSNSEKKYVPNFLVDTNEKNIDKNNISKGLKLVGDFLDKSVLKPNNINYPPTRLDFVNLFK